MNAVGGGGEALHQRELAHRVARHGIDAGRGRERRAERHPHAHTCGRGLLIGGDDALVAIFVNDHQRRPARGRMQRQQRQRGHVRGDPQLARFAREYGL